MRAVAKWLSLLGWLFLPLIASAQGGDIGPKVAHALSLVAEAMDAGRDEEALQRLQVLAQRRLRAPERALVARTRGYLLARQGRYPQAIAALREALDTGALQGEALQAVRLDLGQLLLAEGKDSEGLALLDAWRRDGGKLTAPLVDWIAFAYYRTGRAREAAAVLDQALRRFSPSRRSWYELRVALYLEADQVDEAARLLRQGLGAHPDSAFLWRQSAVVALRRDHPEQALADLMLAYGQGLLPAEDLVWIARLYRQLDAPYHGARLLRAALERGDLEADADRWGLVAEALVQARERQEALAAFERASALAEDGRWDLRRGELLLEAERWQAAREALEQALERGVKRVARARYLLGVALAQSGEVEAARARFQAVAKDARLGRYARQWLQRLG